MARLPTRFEGVVNASQSEDSQAKRWAVVMTKMGWRVDRETGLVVAWLRAQQNMGRRVRHQTLYQCAVALGVL